MWTINSEVLNCYVYWRITLFGDTIWRWLLEVVRTRFYPRPPVKIFKFPPTFKHMIDYIALLLKRHVVDAPPKRCLAHNSPLFICFFVESFTHPVPNITSIAVNRLRSKWVMIMHADYMEFHCWVEKKNKQKSLNSFDIQKNTILANKIILLSSKLYIK